MSLFLGVDAGQSHLEAALVDGQGRLLGTGHTGSWIRFNGNVIEHQFMDAFEDVLRQSFVQADKPFSEGLTAACFGMTGNWEKVGDAIRQIVRVQRLLAYEDTFTAHAGAFVGMPGIILVAGTGVVAYGVDPAGQSMRAGGWGYVVSDEGGGYDLGVRCLRAAAWAYDGRGPATLLLDRVLSLFHQPDIAGVEAEIYSGRFTHADIAGLSKLVADTAFDGDLVAQMLIDESARLLAQHVWAVAQRLRWEDPVVSASGGLFRTGVMLHVPFRRYLQCALPRCQLVAPRYPPILGAVWLSLSTQMEFDKGKILENLDIAHQQLTKTP